MRCLPFAALLILLLVPGSAAALEIRSLTPSSGEPGAEVVIGGGPFDEDIRVQFGEKIVPPRVQNQRRISFTVPDLPAGDYLVNLIRDDAASERNFLFRVLEPAPRIESISPASIDHCAIEEDPLVTIAGRNFKPGSTVLVDDAAVAKESASPTSITFSLPPLKGGTHEVKVVNPTEKSSLAHTLFVNTTPEIYSVSQGEGQVNSYKLIISGKNFQHNSVLYVDGRQVLDPSITRPKSDYVTYLDCRTLIYKRFPFTWELSRVSLQVVNPSGAESPVFEVTIP